MTGVRVNSAGADGQPTSGQVPERAWADAVGAPTLPVHGVGATSPARAIAAGTQPTAGPGPEPWSILALEAELAALGERLAEAQREVRQAQAPLRADLEAARASLSERFAECAALTRLLLDAQVETATFGERLAALEAERLASRHEARARDLADRLLATQSALRRAEETAAEMEAVVAAIHASTSWRLTQPLRRGVDWLRGTR